MLILELSLFGLASLALSLPFFYRNLPRSSTSRIGNPAMNTTISNQQVCDKVHREHEALREELRQIHNVLKGPVPAPSEIAELLQEFEESLLAHFQMEETDGFFEPGRNVAPPLEGEANRLCNEHHLLRHQAADLCHFAASGDYSLPWWRELGARCHAFSQKLMHHESAENRLVEVANREITEGADWVYSIGL